jgi:UDP-N-acetylmuramoyl-tripeptide--D-alanyl-D-alanine ligase
VDRIRRLALEYPIKAFRRGLKAMKTGHLFRAKRRIRTWLAIRRRTRSDAVFVGVTGSSAKTSTVALLTHILAGHGTVSGQFIRNTFRTAHKTVRKASVTSDYVVVEAGVETKGDMLPVARILQPDIAIVTLIGLEHYSAFRSKEAVAEEKGALVEAVRPGGFVLLNADDPHALSMRARTRERVVTFGREAPADYRVTETSVGFPEGLEVALDWKGGSLVLQTQFAGEHFWVTTAAATVAALELGVPVETIVDRVASFEGVRNRCQVYKTRHGPQFIIDTVKIPYGTLNHAFRMMGHVKAPYKRIVLGTLSDYAGSSRPKYSDAYLAAREVADEVIFFGETAHRLNISAEDREAGRFHRFTDVKEVYEHIRSTVRRDEVILLKSSGSFHLERVAFAFNTDVACWERACGLRQDCNACGLFGHPFAEHRAIRRRQKLRALRDLIVPWRASRDARRRSEQSG